MSNKLNWNIYCKIHKSKKVLDNYNIKCALPNEQQKYFGKCLDKIAPEKKFTVIQNRKEHKIRHLSYTLLGHIYHCIMRVDFYGEPHNGIPTPHIHIFVPGKKNKCYTCYLPNVKGYDLNKDPKQATINFLKYNNFIGLNRVNFIGRQLSLFHKKRRGK